MSGGVCLKFQKSMNHSLWYFKHFPYMTNWKLSIKIDNMVREIPVCFRPDQQGFNYKKQSIALLQTILIKNYFGLPTCCAKMPSAWQEKLSRQSKLIKSRREEARKKRFPALPENCIKAMRNSNLQHLVSSIWNQAESHKILSIFVRICCSHSVDVSNQLCSVGKARLLSQAFLAVTKKLTNI